MAFLIARKNRAAVAAAATVTERTVAFADINLMLSRGKSSFKTPPSSDLGKNLQRLPSLGLPFSREQRSSPEADPDAGCPPWSSPPLWPDPRESQNTHLLPGPKPLQPSSPTRAVVGAHPSARPMREPGHPSSPSAETSSPTRADQLAASTKLGGLMTPRNAADSSSIFHVVFFPPLCSQSIFS